MTQSIAGDAAALVEKYGPWALVVGSSQGLGAEYSRVLAAAGFNCVLLDRTQSLLEELKTELVAEYGVEIIAVTTDLSVPGASDIIAEAIGEREVGLMIYNAGSPPYSKAFLDGTLADWSGLLQKNGQTLMECCYRFGGKMVERGRGGIVLVGSHAAFGGTRKLGVYTATKGFVANLGESLWIEWADKGVDVLNMIIGSADTPTMRQTMQELGIEITDDMNMAKPAEIVAVSLRELPNGPSFVFPEDERAEPGSHTVGQQRREHVLESTRVAAVFIGKD